MSTIIICYIKRESILNTINMLFQKKKEITMNNIFSDCVPVITRLYKGFILTLHCIIYYCKKSKSWLPYLAPLRY